MSSCPGSSEEAVNAAADPGEALPAIADDQDLLSDILWDWVAQWHGNELVTPSYWLDVVTSPDQDFSTEEYFAGQVV
jgi:hypothetical protein